MGRVVPETIRGASQQRTIAYIVKMWPRLSETFVLNEILSLERRGVPIRIFSAKGPDGGPTHSTLARVRSEVTYLVLWPQWKQALLANLRVFGRRPGRYVRVLLEATAKVVHKRRVTALRHFIRAGYLADILHREPADHIHAHFASAPALIAMFAHRLSGLPYTFTAHAKDVYLNDPNTFRVKLERAQAVVTCTDYNRRFLLTRFGTQHEQRVHCIRHGLDIAQFQFGASGIVHADEPVILSVARLVEKKGLVDLIAAADLLRHLGRSFRVEIFGDGPLRRALEDQVTRLRLRDRVALLGAQAHDTVCLAYQRASVFVLPCVIASDGDRDGIPNVLLEAMASGVPVVSTRISSIPELVESGIDGLLVPPNNPTRLADAIDRLLASQAFREALVRAARSKIERSFSLDASADRLLDVFERAAPEDRRHLGGKAPPCRGTSRTAG